MSRITVEMRVAQVKAMHEVIINANAEGIYMSWINLVPDEPSDDDFEYIAEDDELYNEVCDKFARLVSMNGYRV